MGLWGWERAMNQCGTEVYVEECISTLQAKDSLTFLVILVGYPVPWNPGGWKPSLKEVKHLNISMYQSV